MAMGMTTTESLGQRSSLRCEACGTEARGGVMLKRADGKFVGVCCATGFLRHELLRTVDPDAPEHLDQPAFVAADPFSAKPGATSPARRVIAEIQRRGAKAPTAERGRYRQAFPEVVAEVLADLGSVAPKPTRLNEPALPLSIDQEEL